MRKQANSGGGEIKKTNEFSLVFYNVKKNPKSDALFR